MGRVPRQVLIGAAILATSAAGCIFPSFPDRRDAATDAPQPDATEDAMTPDAIPPPDVATDPDAGGNDEDVTLPEDTGVPDDTM